jgi:hypothetical protein
LSAGTTYYYRLRASNGSGVSANSNVITAQTAAASTVLIQEGFDYAIGSSFYAQTQTGGIGFTPASYWLAEGAASVVTGLSYPGLATVGAGAIRCETNTNRRVSRLIASDVFKSTFYMSMLINANSIETSRFGFELRSAEGPLFGRAGGGWGLFAGANGKLGISNSNGSFQTWTGVVAPADSATHLIVFKVDFAANAIKLFVDPTPGGAEPAPSATLVTGGAWTINPSADVTAWNRVGLWRSAINQTADELRIGRTWADVTPGTAAPAAPTALAAPMEPNAAPPNVMTFIVIY